MTATRLEYLLQQYLRQAETPGERAELMELVARNDQEAEINRLLEEARDSFAGKDHLTHEQSERIFQAIQLMPAKVVPLAATRRSWLKWIAAASLLLIAGAATWYLLRNPVSSGSPQTVQATNDVTAPVINKATLTLADGTKVVLDSAGNGIVAAQGNMNVTKSANGQLVYNPGGSPVDGRTPLIYNTLTNPNGSNVIAISLADGSKVWLNAGSSLRYPVAFTGNERHVSITGEAYFEVAHDAAKPFYVTKGDMEVKVLGTHFNVNAYDDEEEVKVTLLEGSVKVKSESPVQGTPLEKAGKSGSNEVIIKPGEQARLSEIRDPIRVIRDIHVIRDTDIDQVMAWKNGLFNFNNANLQQVMRQLERWYNVEVKYEGPIPETIFHGKMGRDLNLSEVLNFLTKLEIKSRLEGRTLIIY